MKKILLFGSGGFIGTNLRLYFQKNKLYKLVTPSAEKNDVLKALDIKKVIKKISPDFIINALEGKNIIINGDESFSTSLCYVTDLVDGLVRLMASAPDVQIVNLGDDGWIHLGPGTLTGAGILINRQSKDWSGYAWSAALGASNSGIGWLFPQAHGGIIAQPWVETKGGDIYSGGNIRAVPPVAPVGLYNSAYLIQASGNSGAATIDWISQSGNTPPVVNPDSLPKSLPSANGDFATPLGRIDFACLQV